jgi:la-related protein 1
MDGSSDVEISADKTQMRTKHTPEKWPIIGDPHTFSNLKVDVPEFVPGQTFKLPVQSGMSLSLLYLDWS